MQRLFLVTPVSPCNQLLPRRTVRASSLRSAATLYFLALGFRVIRTGSDRVDFFSSNGTLSVFGFDPSTEHPVGGVVIRPFP